MNTQEAYELMRVYLTRPGATRAYNERGCAYETWFGEDVHRCAVGCLLTPQTLYQEIDFGEEGSNEDQYGLVTLAEYVGSIRNLKLDGYKLPELADVDLSFLVEAQAIHDDSRNWPQGQFFVAALDAAACRHGLTVVDDRQMAPREEAADERAFSV